MVLVIPKVSTRRHHNSTQTGFTPKARPAGDEERAGMLSSAGRNSMDQAQGTWLKDSSYLDYAPIERCDTKISAPVETVRISVTCI